MFVQGDGGKVHAAYDFGGGIEVSEAPGRNVARQGLRKAVGHRLLGQHQAPVGPGDAGLNGVVVHGLDGAQVEQFNASWKCLGGFLCPVHAASVGHDGGRAVGVLQGIVGGNHSARFAKRHAVVAVGFNDLGRLGARDFGPVQPFVLQNHHRIGVFEGCLEKALQIGAVGGIGHLDTSDVGEDRLDARAVVRSTAAVRADWHANEAVDGPLAVAEHVAPAQFREELIQTGPEVVRKLDFHDGLASRGAHAQGRADDEGLLDGGVEDAVVAKFLAQRGGFTEHTSQARAHVLAVQQCLGMVLHDLLHGVQGAVHHQCHFPAGGVAFAALLGHCGRGVAVGQEVLNAGLLSRLRSVEGLLDGGVDFGIEQIELGLVHS